MQNVFLRVFQTPVVIVYSPIIVFLHGHFEVLVFGDRVRGFVPWEPILLQDDSRRRFVLAECRPDRDCVDNLMFVDQASQTPVYRLDYFVIAQDARDSGRLILMYLNDDTSSSEESRVGKDCVSQVK